MPTTQVDAVTGRKGAAQAPQSAGRVVHGASMMVGCFRPASCAWNAATWLRGERAREDAHSAARRRRAAVFWRCSGADLDACERWGVVVRCLQARSACKKLMNGRSGIKAHE